MGWQWVPTKAAASGGNTWDKATYVVSKIAPTPTPVDKEHDDGVGWFGKIWNGIKDFGSGAWDEVKRMVGGIVNIINIIRNPGRAAKGLWYGIKHPTALWQAFIQPYIKDWQSGHPLRAVGRATVFLLPLLLSGGSSVAGEAGELGEAAAAAGEAGELGEAAAAAGEAGELGEAAAAAGEAGEATSAAGEASELGGAVSEELSPASKWLRLGGRVPGHPNAVIIKSKTHQLDALVYEERALNKPVRWFEIKVNGVGFDWYEGDTLLDAKFAGETKSFYDLTRPEQFIQDIAASRIRKQLREQLEALEGSTFKRIEWRVADPKVAEALKKFVSQEFPDEYEAGKIVIEYVAP